VSDVETQWTPRVPDTPEPEFEYIPIVMVDGREWGRREQVDITTSYGYACETGRCFVENVGNGATYVILRRPVGAWEQWDGGE